MLAGPIAAMVLAIELPATAGLEATDLAATGLEATSGLAARGLIAGLAVRHLAVGHPAAADSQVSHWRTAGQ